MQYSQFESILTPQRMSRYLTATANDTKKAMTLYRANLKLSTELYTIISCFEVAYRNAVDKYYVSQLGGNWLRDAASPGGIFDNPNCHTSQLNINEAITKLSANYTHHKLVAELGFGFWRYMFAPHQFQAGGQSLLAIFPSRPQSTPAMQYNAKHVFKELVKINNIRNRIAHHEPICFQPGAAQISTVPARREYGLIKQLFQWMDINESSLLYGLDHVDQVCNAIDALRK